MLFISYLWHSELIMGCIILGNKCYFFLQLTFPVSGWNPWGQAVRNADGTKIDLCGGWNGACVPSGAMTLILAPPGSAGTE